MGQCASDTWRKAGNRFLGENRFLGREKSEKDSHGPRSGCMGFSGFSGRLDQIVIPQRPNRGTALCASGGMSMRHRDLGLCLPEAKFQTLPNLLLNGMWAAESLHLLQRMSETFAVGNNKLLGALQGGPLPDSMTRIARDMHTCTELGVWGEHLTGGLIKAFVSYRLIWP